MIKLIPYRQAFFVKMHDFFQKKLKIVKMTNFSLVLQVFWVVFVKYWTVFIVLL